MAFDEGRGEVDVEGAAVAVVLQDGWAKGDFVDLEGRIELELDAGAVFEHFEADGVGSGDELLLRVDAEVEVVIEEVVVGAVGAVGAAEEILGGGFGDCGLYWGRVRRRCLGEKRRSRTG